MKATSTGGMLKGLKRSNPPGTDASGWATKKGGSVEKDAVRKGVAPTPKSLGPRNA